MSVPVDPARLRYELAVRGMEAIELAKMARLSPATVSAALGGKPISEASLRLIATALQSTPVVAVIERLLAPAVRTAGTENPSTPVGGVG